MRIKESENIRKKLKTLDDEHLIVLKMWLDDRVGKDSEDKLRLVNLEFKRREKARNYASYLY